MDWLRWCYTWYEDAVTTYDTASEWWAFLKELHTTGELVIFIVLVGAGRGLCLVEEAVEGRG